MGQWMSSGQVDKKDRAMLELKLQRDKLRQYEKKLSRVIHEELTLAKEQLKRNNHHAARLCLAKKKYQQSLLKKTEDQLFTLDQLTGALEFALVLKGLQEGNTVLAMINDEMDLDKVQKIMDDTKDGIAYQNEIQDMITREFTEEDEEDVMRELDALLDIEAKEKMKGLELPPAATDNLVVLASKDQMEILDLLEVPIAEPHDSGTKAQNGKDKGKREKGKQQMEPSLLA